MRSKHDGRSVTNPKPNYWDRAICCCMVLVELGQQGKWMLLNSVDDMRKWEQIFNSEHDTFSRIYDGMCSFISLD